jgi:cephalosporin-C deacetylase-like acetyl esterase
VYLFNFSGPKARESYSSLGVRQAEDLMQAIATVTKQAEVNPHRVGLFGTNLGGYAALVAAEQNAKVKALAVDTIYTAPERMFEVQIDLALGGSSPLFRYIANAEFRLLNLGIKPYPVRDNLSKLQGVPKLFISGRDFTALAVATEELYNAAPQPKELRVLDHSQASLASASEKKEYEDQVINFFLQNLSLRAD